jgi:hypothetical protein
MSVGKGGFKSDGLSSLTCCYPDSVLGSGKVMKLLSYQLTVSSTCALYYVGRCNLKSARPA